MDLNLQIICTSLFKSVVYAACRYALTTIPMFSMGFFYVASYSITSKAETLNLHKNCISISSIRLTKAEILSAKLWLFVKLKIILRGEMSTRLNVSALLDLRFKIKHFREWYYFRKNDFQTVEVFPLVDVTER